MALLKDLGEDALIELIKNKGPKDGLGIIKSIGDDTAVTRPTPGLVQLISTDTLTEDVHFSLGYSPMKLVGRKCVNISASDVASMGGKALFLLTSISAPPELSVSAIEELYDGIYEACDGLDISLIGGNTSSSKDGLTITTTVIGEAHEKAVIYRDGAKEGDHIYVTGTLGASTLGLRCLVDSGEEALKGPYKEAVLKHLDPTARCTAGALLSKRKVVNAMTDVSDGIVKDLGHISKESGIGMELEVERMPEDQTLKEYASKNKDADSLAFLFGGEEYELAFTSPPDKENDIVAISKELNLSITRIGTVTGNVEGVRVIAGDGSMISASYGFEHFK